MTPVPKPGEKRAAQSFDIRFSTLAEATVDILFSKVKVLSFAPPCTALDPFQAIQIHCIMTCSIQETNAVHMTIGAGSYLEITIPWTVKADGYVSKISGQLLHVDASTSLQVCRRVLCKLK